MTIIFPVAQESVTKGLTQFPNRIPYSLAFLLAPCPTGGERPRVITRSSQDSVAEKLETRTDLDFLLPARRSGAVRRPRRPGFPGTRKNSARNSTGGERDQTPPLIGGRRGSSGILPLTEREYYAKGRSSACSITGDPAQMEAVVLAHVFWPEAGRRTWRFSEIRARTGTDGSGCFSGRIQVYRLTLKWWYAQVKSDYARHCVLFMNIIVFVHISRYRVLEMIAVRSLSRVCRF